MLEWIVLPEEAGMKLIAFLTQRLGSRYSARFIKRALEHNRCQVNERAERFASIIVEKGDHIALNLEGFSATPSLAFELSRLLYEDADLLIYNKPPGVNSDEQGVLTLLKSYSPQLQLIHRLDRDTTGVLLLAKNAGVFKLMVEQFREFKVQKCYMAIVDGVPDKPKGTVENYLGKKHHYDGQTIWGAVNQNKGSYACTEWVKVKAGKQCSLIYCYPKTGRTHQIRVHLAGMGHPLLGDFQYSKQFHCSYRPDRYLLHAREMSFQHPVTHQPVHVKAPVPDDFKQAEKQLFKT